MTAPTPSNISANWRTLALVGTLLALCLVLLAWSTDNRAASPIVGTHIPENFHGALEIGANMRYLKDSDHQLTIHSILNHPLNWSLVTRSSPNFGFTQAAYWFQVVLHNEADLAQEVLLELPIPFLDQVDLYRVRQGEILQTYTLGDTLPYTQRPIEHPNFVMPLRLEAGDNELYLRIASSGTVEAPLTVWSSLEFLQNASNVHLVEGLWGGMVLIMAIYNLMLFFSIRDQGYLYYAAFAFSFLLFQLSLSGYGFAYLWPESLRWNSHAIPTMIAMANMMAALLTLSFLNLKQTSPTGHKLMTAMAVLGGFLMAISFFAPYSLTIRAGALMTVLMSLIIPAMSFSAWYRGDHHARYFGIGWSVTLLGICLLGLNKFGLIPVNFLTNNAGNIGIVFMMALLSLALADRFNREREMRLNAQMAALESEKQLRLSQEEVLATKEEANQQLELKVRERTQTLQKALLDLEQANQRLELLSTTDALTTLFNRAYFESRVEIEFRRAQRHHRDLSIILCDVDFFKQINDMYGHKIGDACLRNFAIALKNKVIRSGDLIARYGGEEFIIMLVDTPLQDAEYIASALCEEVRNMSLEAKGKPLQITASFGVASLKQSLAGSAEDLIHRADMAMYQSKNTGRDRVTLWHKVKEQSL